MCIAELDDSIWDPAPKLLSCHIDCYHIIRQNINMVFQRCFTTLTFSCFIGRWIFFISPYLDLHQQFSGVSWFRRPSRPTFQLNRLALIFTPIPLPFPTSLLVCYTVVCDRWGFKYFSSQCVDKDFLLEVVQRETPWNVKTQFNTNKCIISFFLE